MTVTMIEASVTLFVTSCVFCSIAAACDATSWRNNSAESPCYENATVTVASNPGYWVCEHDGMETWTVNDSELESEDLMLLSQRDCAPINRR